MIVEYSPSMVISEKRTGNLRMKNGIVQECIEVDRRDSHTNAYTVYREWRNIEVVDGSAPDFEPVFSSYNWNNNWNPPMYTISEGSNIKTGET